MSEKKQVLPSEVARALGSIKTPKKSASSARNVAPYKFARKPLSEIECTCKKCPDVDSPEAQPGSLGCKRGRAIYQRRYREKQQSTSPDSP